MLSAIEAEHLMRRCGSWVSDDSLDRAAGGRESEYSFSIRTTGALNGILVNRNMKAETPVYCAALRGNSDALEVMLRYLNIGAAVITSEEGGAMPCLTSGDLQEKVLSNQNHYPPSASASAAAPPSASAAAYATEPTSTTSTAASTASTSSKEANNHNQTSLLCLCPQSVPSSVLCDGSWARREGERIAALQSEGFGGSWLDCLSVDDKGFSALHAAVISRYSLSSFRI